MLLLCTASEVTVGQMYTSYGTRMLKAVASLKEVVVSWSLCLYPSVVIGSFGYYFILCKGFGKMRALEPVGTSMLSSSGLKIPGLELIHFCLLFHNL